MHLINASMSGKLSTIPNSLPRSFYEKSDLQPPLSINTPGPSTPATGSSTPSLRLKTGSLNQEWIITPTLRAYANALFSVHDPQKSGQVAGDTVYAFMLDSGLPADVLAIIWYIPRCIAYLAVLMVGVFRRDLADTSQRGSLTREEFTVASFLLEKAKEGEEMPRELPPSLIASALSINDTEEGGDIRAGNVSRGSQVSIPSLIS